MKDPAFLFYSQDFIVGTLTMSFVDKGKYITILAVMHQQGRLSEKAIISLVGSVSESLKSKFKVDEKGNWYNSRLEKEINERNKYVERCRENGKKGGRPKKEEKPTENPNETHGFFVGKPKPNPEPNPNETISSSSSIITISNDIVKPKKTSGYAFIDSLIEEFKKSYYESNGIEYETIAIGKERKNVSRILSAFKKKNPKATTNDTISELRRYFDMCNSISDQWLKQNMSLSIIVSKFNEINNILRNGNKRTAGNKSATTDAELAGVLAKHFATDYAE